eukprot:4235522-Pleurochrysis_carterae.AAC.1
MAPCGTEAVLVAMLRCAVCGPRGASGGNTTGATSAAPLYMLRPTGSNARGGAPRAFEPLG